MTPVAKKGTFVLLMARICYLEDYFLGERIEKEVRELPCLLVRHLFLFILFYLFNFMTRCLGRAWPLDLRALALCVWKRVFQ